ncbi:MAG TPA: sulfotransferase [Rhizomicrobium sp.]|nr:sulfotransferase [Rhizomicrobium sp.]
MNLKVVGAGFGRTGTHSLKIALEMLGFAPCYHMVEVFTHSGHSEAWEAAARGDKIDWEALIGGYQASVDWPASYFWRELAAMNPGAKIVLTERDPELWYKSIASTIFEFMSHDDSHIKDPILLAQRKMGRYVLNGKLFGGDFSKEHVLEVYARNSADVRREVPKDRLLVFDPLQGWEPLCSFLGVKVPETPYPLTNTTEEFRNRAQARAVANK